MLLRLKHTIINTEQIVKVSFIEKATDTNQPALMIWFTISMMRGFSHNDSPDLRDFMSLRGDDALIIWSALCEISKEVSPEEQSEVV